MNQVKTVRTPIHKQREFRQKHKAIEAENEHCLDTLSGTWITGSIQVSKSFRLIKQSMVWMGPQALTCWSKIPPVLKSSRSIKKIVKTWLLG